ncbi:MAG: T9SS type A sorting domain-containing protein [Bacteroidota bacterium]
MRRNLCLGMLTISLLLALPTYAQRFWVGTGATNNWNNTDNWSTTSGGAGGASVPGPTDAVTFNAAGNVNCVLDIAPTVAAITLNGYTATIDLNGFVLTTTGNNTFASGTLADGAGTGSLTLNTTGSTTFSGTTFGAVVNGSTGRVFFNGSTFNSGVDITKTANATDLSTGGNTFNGAVTLTNTSANPFRLGGTNPDIFGSTLALTVGGTGALEIAYTAAGTQLNHNVTVTYNSTALISVGANGGSATLADGRTLSVAGFGGAGCGNLTLARLTQVGGTAQSITLAGNNTATLTLGPGSTFNAALTATTPSIIFNASSFQAVTVTKTGTITDNSRGGNIFNGLFTLNNQGGDFVTGSNAADAGDTWMTGAVFNNSGGYRIRIGEDNAGNLFNGNVTFNNTSITDIQNRIQIARFGTAEVTFNGTVTFDNGGNGSDVHISYAAGSSTTFNGPVLFHSNASNGAQFWVGQDGNVSFGSDVTVTSSTDGVIFGNNSGLVNMAAGSTVIIGGAGFSAGELRFRNFTQAGAAPLSLPLTGTAILRFANANIGGAVTGAASQLFMSATTFQSSVTLEKTGATDNSSSGNTFNGPATITNSGTAEIFMGNGAADTFNGAAVFNNSGSYRIRLAYNHDGQTTTFANGLTLNSNKTGGADTWSFLVGDFNNSNITINGNLVINCGGTLRSDHRFMNGTGTLTLNGDLIINNTNTHASTTITMGANGTSVYNGNITLTNTGGSSGITFNSGITASSVQSTGNLSIVSGFDSGNLNVHRFTQLGGASVNLDLGGTTTLLRVGPSTAFSGNIDLRAPRIFLDGVTVSGTAYIEKKGANNDTGAGNNVFLSTATIVNNGTGQLRTNGNNSFGGTTTITNNSTADVLLELTSGSTYNGAVTFNNTNSSNLRVAYAGNTHFNNNIIVNSTAGTGIIFCELGGATATLADGFTVSIGGSGFSAGTLTLQRFTQLGATPQVLTAFSGTTALTVGPSSAFGGNVTFTAPRLQLNGCNYSGTVTLQKTGGGDDVSSGGNVFSGVTNITNSGTGYLLLGNGSRDEFLSATTFHNTGGYRIYFAHNHPGQTTTFASDLTLNTNKTSGTDPWSYLVAENGTSAISVAGNLVINCLGSIESDHRFLSGTGSIASFGGTVDINITNTSAGTAVIMGENGTTTYNNNISITNSGGSSGVTFNNGTTASSILTNGAISATTFTSGSLNLYRFTQTGAFANNLTLSGGAILRVGPNSSFDGPVNFVAPRLLLNGATYNNTTYLEKNGTGDDNGAGGNIFNGTTTLVASGSGYLLTANTTADVFNGPLTLTNSGSNFIYLAHNVAGNQFNNDITLNNTGSALGIVFANNTTGAATFTGGTLLVGGSGFSTGDLRLRRFTQSGPTAQSLTLTGSARLWIGPNSQFDGDVNFVSPQLLLNGATYNGTARLEKSGASPSGANDGTGGNVFNQEATIVNSGSAYLLTGLTSPDIFNGRLIITNSGSSTIRMADTSPGNAFNGNIELNSTFGGGIYFGNGGGTSTLADTRTIGVGTSGVISGDIRLIRFTQVGSAAQTLNLTGIAILTLGPSSVFNGDVDFRAPQILLNGTRFEGITYIEKNGANNNTGNGGNIFQGATTLVNAGSGYLLTANSAADVFNGSLTVTNTGSSIIYLAHNVPGNEFNGNITFNSTLGSGGVYFANNSTGNATLGTGASLLVGGLGYSSGELRFRRFTQTGSAPQTLLLTGTALLRVGPATTFNGTIDFRAPQFALDGTTFNGTTYLEKTGATNNDSNGGNIFNGPTTIANSGAGWFRFAVTALDTFNGDLTLNNTGSSSIRMADNVAGTVFNGNVIVNSTSGGGIFFSESGGGTATLASGRTISVGGLGFSLGELRLRRFTQSGTAAQTLVFTGTAGITLGPGITFNGPVNFSAPQLIINAGTYNNTASLTKTGASNNGGTGACLFESTTIISNSGSGYLRTDGGHTFNGTTQLTCAGSNYLLLELTTGSTYNGALSITNSGSSNVRVAYQGNTAFNNNIEVNSTGGSGIYFGEAGGSSSTLASGRTITVGGTGFSGGELRLQRFTQLGTTAQSLTLTGAAIFRSGVSSLWNGNLTVAAPRIFLDGVTLNGANNQINKTGASTDSSNGGNTFGGNTTFSNTGTGIFRFANGAADDFTGHVVFNQASGTIQPAYNFTSTFRGNISVDGATSITFGANNGTLSFADNANQTVNRLGAASPTFRRLLINKTGGSVTLNTDVTISTSATFTAGVLNTTASNVINFADNATVSGGSNASYVDGPVRKTGNDAFTFPTGDNGIYRAIAISAPSVVTNAFTAEYFFAPQAFGSTLASPLLIVSGCEYWTLDRNAGTSSVAVTIGWNSSDCTGAYVGDLATLRVVRFDGSQWVDHGNAGTTGTVATGTITSNAISAFSPIALGTTSLANPLPIELLSFTASRISNNVRLQWTTASEINNDYFEVQRSADGIEFETLTTQKGAGTSSERMEYKFDDTAPITGTAYYRLKQVDFDGSSSYSSVVSILFETTYQLTVWPNPAVKNETVFLSQKGNFALINSQGVVVRQVTNTDHVDLADVPTGVYIIKSEGGVTRRLVIH